MTGRVALDRGSGRVDSGAVEPLVPLWRSSTVAPQRAGARTTARLVLENGGAATWRSRGADGLQLSYHWLDTHGNAIVWDGTRTAFPQPVAPGETVGVDVPLDAPRPPGRYVLRFDLVEEHRFWLSELGVGTHDLEVDVAPLIAERRLAVVVHGGPDGRTERRARRAGGAARRRRRPRRRPTSSPARSRRPTGRGSLLDAHAEGWPAVGPALVAAGGPLERRRAARGLAAVGARRTQPAPRRPAPASLARRGARARRASRPAGLRGRGALRGTGGRQASDAIRSSTDLNTNAPSASATPAATTRYSRSPVGGSSPS